MSITVLRAIDEDIQMRKNAIEQFNASIQVELNTIEQLKASIQTELNAIQDLETARKTVIKVMPVIVPDVQDVPTVQVETFVEKSVNPAIQIIEKPKDLIVQEKSIFILSSDNYLSDDKNDNETTNKIKLLDRDFNFDQQFDVKCIRKEVGNAEYNLTHNGKLLHWINEKGKYSSTYKSGTKFTPFEPLKACLYYKDYEQIDGMIYFPKQSKTMVSNEEKSSEFNMDMKHFPSLKEKK